MELHLSPRGGPFGWLCLSHFVVVELLGVLHAISVDLGGLGGGESMGLRGSPEIWVVIVASLSLRDFLSLELDTMASATALGVLDRLGLVLSFSGGF